MDHDTSQCREIWEMTPDGRMMCALVNGDIGWLMYLREAGDAGFSSRNPDYAGEAGATVAYRLSNGQVDHFPRAWAYPVVVVEEALAVFRRTGTPADFIAWHNDSGDGTDARGLQRRRR